MLMAAIDAAGASPRTAGSVDAHGTGTALGDPIEMGSIVDVTGLGRSSGFALCFGPVKANAGHLENTAAGAGLLAVVVVSLGRSRALPSAELSVGRERRPPAEDPPSDVSESDGTEFEDF